MTNIFQKAEALAARLGKDVETLWVEFEAFCEGKKKVEEASKSESEGSTAPVVEAAAASPETAPAGEAQPAATEAQPASAAQPGAEAAAGTEEAKAP